MKRYGKRLVVVERDWQIDDGANRLSNQFPRQPEWLRAILGSDFFDSIALISFLGNIVTDHEVHEARQFRQLRWLDVHSDFDVNEHICDASLAHIEGLMQLQKLDLRGTLITDSGLVYLTRLSQLRQLRLYGTRVTGAGVKRLQESLPNCEITY